MFEAPVLIIGAVSGELFEIRKCLDRETLATVGRKPYARGLVGDIEVRIMETGPGIANTVQAVTAAVEQERPGLIIQIGCAGVFRKTGLGIGDIGVASEEIDVHLGVEPETETDPPEPLPFPVFSTTEGGYRERYPLNPEFFLTAADILQRSTRRNDAGIILGPFITVSTVTATDRRAERLFRQYGAPCMETMEGAGAAFAALIYHIPFLEIRSASNFVGERRRDSWDIPLACRRSSEAAVSVLKGLSKAQS